MYNKFNNNCINIGYFPKYWKKAEIVTIPKKAGLCTPGDLRPISLTFNLRKLLKAAVLKNVMNAVKEGAIPEHQLDL